MVRNVIILVLTFIGLTVSPAAAQRNASYNKLPLSFEPDGVDFVARGEGYLLRLTPTRETLTLQETSSVTLTLAGANPSAQADALDPQPGKTNYLMGNDPAKWRTNIPNFARVRYRDIYPGVDIVYYGNRQQLEYDLVVNPGADPHAIQLAFDGIQSMRITAEGDLLLTVPGGDIRQHKPVIYQESDGIRQPVEGHYVRKGNRTVAFELAKYDANRRLIVDPRLTYSTFLGSISRSHRDQGNAIAVDSAGNAYVTGWTMSPDFPLKGAIQTVYRAPYRTAFVTKLNASGTALVYSTYLGGTGPNGEEGRGIAVDSSGHAYVAGSTMSPDFPVTPNAFQTVFHGGSGFVSKLSVAGDGLLYSTFLGLNVLDGAEAIAVDASENAYVTGHTQSQDFPVTPGAYQTAASGFWVSKLNTIASGAGSLVYSTYIGKGFGMSRGIAVDSSGNAYITGNANTAGFSTPGAFQTSYHAGSGNDAFVTKLNAAGSALVYSTYLGGTSDDVAYGIAVDPLGNALVAGSTISTDFPATPGAFQTTFQAGRSHCFVTKVNPNGDGLIYSTFLTGSGDTIEQCNAIATDFAGNAYVAGSTTSITFPVTADGFRSSAPSSLKGFASKLSAAGDRLIFSTYLTGDNQDIAYGIAVDPATNAYVTGYSTSPGFPVTPGAFQTLSTPCCMGKAFVTAIAADIGVRLAQSGLTFQAVQGGGVPSPKSFRFFNATSLPMNYSVAASTLSGGTWLNISPNSGSINPDQPATINVSVNHAGLAPGDYYGQVRIDGTAAPNAPQFLTIVLNVSASTTNPGPVVEPAGLAFMGLVGATTPLAQSVHLTNLTNRGSPFTASGTSTSAHKLVHDFAKQRYPGPEPADRHQSSAQHWTPRGRLSRQPGNSISAGRNQPHGGSVDGRLAFRHYHLYAD